MSWDFFLSHAGTNGELASTVKDALEQELVDGRPMRVWLDDIDIPAGGSIPKHIEEGLRESRCFGILMTAAYFQSTSGWTDAEWHAILHQDPDNRSRKLLPILAGDCNVPFLLAHFKRIDLRGPNHFRSGIAQIARAVRGDDARKPQPRGALAIDSALPDVCDETLYSNIFGIDNVPSQIYTAELAQTFRVHKGRLTRPRFEAQLGSQVDAARLPPYHLDDLRIVLFGDPNDSASPLRPFVNSATVQALSPRSTGLTAATRRHIVALLNRALYMHLNRNEVLFHMEDDDRWYYGPTNLGGPRTVTYPSGHRTPTRQVAKPITNARTGEVLCWLHQAASLRFVQLGVEYVLQIRPSYILTAEGRTHMGGSKVAKTINRWTSRERNAQIFRHVMFWRWTVASMGTTIATGGVPLQVADIPIAFRLPVGLEADHIDLLRILGSADSEDDSPLLDEALDSLEADEEQV